MKIASLIAIEPSYSDPFGPSSQIQVRRTSAKGTVACNQGGVLTWIVIPSTGKH